MPKKYFCEYCGIYLTNSSPRTRKEHCRGRKHINNKIEYFSQFLYEFQQNAYNNLLNVAAKINKPKEMTPQPSAQSFNSFQKFIIPANPMHHTFNK
jgi:hypothetical protein